VGHCISFSHCRRVPGEWRLKQTVLEAVEREY
jgi:hypothetical protein